MSTLLILLLVPLAADWDRFRGANGSGVGEPVALPSSPVPANAIWKVAVPFGRSSPIVVGGRVVMTAAEKGQLVTLAIDAATGRQVWRREIKPPRSQAMYKANDPASPTPASDGKNLYVFFQDVGLVSYTLDGKERWRHPLGPFDSFYGLGTSPVVSNGLVFLLCDQAKDSFLLAVDANTGKQRWRVDRAGYPVGWSAPIVHQDQLITVGSSRIDSYFLSTGEPRWWTPIASIGSMGTPVVHEGRLLVSAGGSEQPWMPPFPVDKLDRNADGKLSIEECKDEKEWAEHFGWVDDNHDGQIDAKEWETARAFGVGDYGAISLPLNGKGRLDASAVAWRVKRGVPYVPSPLLYEGVFYMVKDGGIVTSIDPVSGAILKQGRADGAPGQYFASPVAAGGKVILLSEEGKLTVLKAGAQWEVAGVSDLGEEGYATPALSGGRMFVRTRGTLFAFGASK